ncbi:TPA: hypothetical protein OBS64_003100 [Escherichia coli]|nr:hypothetical protein [Escherichia coli]
MILTCHGSDLECFEAGAQYEAEKPEGLPKNPFIVVVDTFGHFWYGAAIVRLTVNFAASFNSSIMVVFMSYLMTKGKMIFI